MGFFMSPLPAFVRTASVDINLPGLTIPNRDEWSPGRGSKVQVHEPPPLCNFVVWSISTATMRDNKWPNRMRNQENKRLKPNPQHKRALIHDLGLSYGLPLLGRSGERSQAPWTRFDSPILFVWPSAQFESSQPLACGFGGALRKRSRAEPEDREEGGGGVVSPAPFPRGAGNGARGFGGRGRQPPPPEGEGRGFGGRGRQPPLPERGNQGDRTKICHLA